MEEEIRATVQGMVMGCLRTGAWSWLCMEGKECSTEHRKMAF